ncbi:MAG: phosphatase PAP2 family protein [Actinobacteria bacterium]|nr:phosphatase PAP2 family protein [Actinomycetota bacterium]
MAGLAVTLVGINYALIPHGPIRDRAKWVTGAILVVLAFTRVYLGVEHPTDAAFGAIFGVAVGLTAFRWLTPNDVFPVTYRRGKSAHLDLGGRRGEAILSVLTAQAVPSATLVPCILEFPAGWSYGGSDVRRGVARYRLSSDRGGVRSVEIELSPTCDVTGLAERMDPATELGVRVYQEPLSNQPYAANRYFVFEGGCVVYRWRFVVGAEEAPRRTRPSPR